MSKNLTSQAPEVSKSKPPSEVTVKKAENGGYIVRYYDESYSSKEAVYADMDGVIECLNHKLGGKKKDKG